MQPLLAGMRTSSGPRKAQDLFGDGGIRVRPATYWAACMPACSSPQMLCARLGCADLAGCGEVLHCISHMAGIELTA